MKRLMLLIAAGSLWLFLAAVPVFADGGPHVAAINNGTGNGGATLAADSCAGCHRAHTAQGEFLLKDSGGIATCTSCHGASAAWVPRPTSRTASSTCSARTPFVIRARRSGTSAAVASSPPGSGPARPTAWRTSSGTSVRQNAKVPVRTAGSQAVTSAHLPNTGGVIEAADGVAWGNGPDSATAYAGPEVDVECTTCHNPHGNGAYRILNPIPDPAATGTDVFVPAAAAAPVTDAADSGRRRQPQLHHHPDERRHRDAHGEPGGGPRPAGDGGRLLAAQGSVERHRAARPTTRPTASPQPSTAEISTWCLTCHTRYLSAGWDVETPDAIYKYRHTSNATSRNCITCHVAHGSNAQMPGI